MSLAVNVYTVVETKAAHLAGKRINVAQWVILDDRVLPTSDRKPGGVDILVLEPAEANPQLESERLSRDAEGRPDYLVPSNTERADGVGISRLSQPSVFLATSAFARKIVFRFFGLTICTGK